MKSMLKRISRGLLVEEKRGWFPEVLEKRGRFLDPKRRRRRTSWSIKTLHQTFSNVCLGNPGNVSVWRSVIRIPHCWRI